MKENKNGFLSYGAKGATADPQDKHKGYSFKTSKALIENVICKRDIEPTLFPEAEGTATTEASNSFVDSKGKPVTLSAFQLKVITALTQIVDTQLPKKETQEYIKLITADNLQKRITKKRASDLFPPMIKGGLSVIVDIYQLAKIVYGTSRVGGKQVNNIREAIRTLSQIRQQIRLKDGKSRTLIIEAPLLHLGKTLEYEDKEQKKKLSRAEIIFEDVFVYEIMDKYALSPITLLKLWNETGVNTELFAMLLFLLQEVRGGYINHALQGADALRVELSKKKIDKAEIAKQVAERRRQLLTYKEKFSSICERLNKNTYYDIKKGRTYLRLAKARKDLKQAEEALVRMGIISEYYETTATDGELLCNFVINPDWLKQEAKKIQASRTPEEAENDLQETDYEEL